MSVKRIYFGSLGPHLYEDTDTIDDADGIFPGATRDALVTDGDVNIGGSFIVTGSIYLGGSPTTEGTWRFLVAGKDLWIQRYESGLYITKAKITA